MVANGVDKYGIGVSRVLDPRTAGILQTIWQQGKPPLDSELNFIAQLARESDRLQVLRGVPSGFLGNETNTPQDFVTNPSWSNLFRFGKQRSGERGAIMWAAVNGWLVPVTGTATGAPPGTPNDSDTFNVIKLDPPPANTGDFRIDFVFLEVWLARVAPSPSTANKPSASGLWKFGNVEGGYSFLTDDMKDPAIGFETTERVQLQYRVRVVSGLVGLSSYPDGFDPQYVKGKAAYDPIHQDTTTSFPFVNMRSELGDPGLWRAGDGTDNALGTVDGYSYAVPVCAVFRRNTMPWDGHPAQNLNGSFNRSPTAVGRADARMFSAVATLASDMSATATTCSLTTTTGIPLPLAPLTPVLVRIGDELLFYQSITGTTVNFGVLTNRGAYQTRIEAHKAGSTVEILAVRPDGLFADQIAATDILDLRHAVNPNGFDYDALLRNSFDKLLRGRLRSTWKRTGAGPQGSFVAYQDLIGNDSPSLGIAKLDAPNGIRHVFSDAATIERFECIVNPANPAHSETWGLTISATPITVGTPGQFNPTDTIVIPLSQFRAGLPSGDNTDQVRFVNDLAILSGVSVRIDGSETPLNDLDYAVSPSNPGPGDDLTITLAGSFPPGTTRRLYITGHVIYGGGRGLSRRPNALHSVAYYNTNTTEVMVQWEGVPSNNVPLRVGWAPLWSKYRSMIYNNLLPVTAEAYADLGSKSVILTPFRRVTLPGDVVQIDGMLLHLASFDYANSINGVVAVSPGLDYLGDTAPGQFTNAHVGDRVVISSGPNVGTYWIREKTSNDVVRLNATLTADTGVAYQLRAAEGIMPTRAMDGVTPKWTTTDPLQLFCAQSFSDTQRKNIYITLPRHLVPSWGEVHVPPLHQNLSTSFHEGINFLILNHKGAVSAAESNYVAFHDNSSSVVKTYSVFTTWNWDTATSAGYNTAFNLSDHTEKFAGIRKFTDTRGYGRKGLELPPFYGIGRLFAVYEAQDYRYHLSAYDASTREPTGSTSAAKNLLRQNFDGPTFWIELDADGDSTFILNADALDLTKSPNPISTFETGEYVIEACIFGFDRGSFDLTQPFRLAVARDAFLGSGHDSRSQNVGIAATNITSPVCVIPAAPMASDTILVNYSRTPYQGDAYGSQMSWMDLGYTPGPLTSAFAYQIASTQLDQSSLTRPNQKPLEVLASLGFMTTLGSGRYSGDLPSNATTTFQNVGYEDPSVFPPVSGISARPKVLTGNFSFNNISPVSTEYLGCTSGLPLGALYRDKDFRGQYVGDSIQAQLLYCGTRYTPGSMNASLARQSDLEQTEILLDNGSLASGQPGEILVHVDGDVGGTGSNPPVNFRTSRGGSLFQATGQHPGGEVIASMGDLTCANGSTITLSGQAYLVRNTSTWISGNEVSAGDELMMLVVTTANRLPVFDLVSALVAIGTNGTGEGSSAADLYRIEGHPLLCDNIRAEVDPDTIDLPRPILVRV